MGWIEAKLSTVYRISVHWLESFVCPLAWQGNPFISAAIQPHYWLADWCGARELQMMDSASAVFCEVASRAELRLNSECLSERTLYVLVLKRGADPSSRIPHPAAVWVHISAPPSLGTTGCVVAEALTAERLAASKAATSQNLETATSVLERNYCIVNKQKTWAELSALTP